MQRLKLVIGGIVFFMTVLLSQAQQSQDVLFSIDDEAVTLSEFSDYYHSRPHNYTKRLSVENYLELYIGYRLKLHDAYARKIDASPEFRTEYLNYYNKLIEPYSKDTIVQDMLMDEAYERMQIEIDASHILLKLPKDPIPQDTLDAYDKIEKIQKRLDWGEPFETLALEFSDDPSVKVNRGKLGYFTVFQMMYPFETAAYATSVGEVSKPIRTHLGYHLIKVYDRRLAKGQIQVAHILLKEDSKANQKLIHDIKKRLDDGADFKQLAEDYSQDIKSKHVGGRLPVFGVGRMIKDFERQAFALKEEGDISAPFKTALGWHIIKLIRTYPVGTFTESEPFLRENLLNGERGYMIEQAFVNQLLKKYTYHIDYDLILAFYKYNWQDNQMLQSDNPILSIEKEAYSVLEFYKFFKSQSDMDASLAFDKFKEQKTLQYHKNNLIYEYPEIGQALRTYKNELLIYNQMNQNVWQKVKHDTLALRQYYEAHINDYSSPETVKLITVAFKGDKSDESRVLRQLKRAAKTDDVTDLIDNLSVLNVKDRRDKTAQNNLPEGLKLKKGSYTMVQTDHIKEYYYVQEQFEERVNPYESIKYQVFTDYQNMIEQRWLTQLKAKYKVIVNQDVVARLRSI